MDQDESEQKEDVDIQKSKFEIEGTYLSKFVECCED